MPPEIDELKLRAWVLAQFRASGNERWPTVREAAQQLRRSQRAVAECVDNCHHMDRLVAIRAGNRIGKLPRRDHMIEVLEDD